MQIQTPADSTFKPIIYNQEGYADFLASVEQEVQQKSFYLGSLIGPYLPNKLQAADEIAEKLNLDVQAHNMEDLIGEDVTDLTNIKSTLNEVFDTADAQNDLLFFARGDRLCGVFTGYTFSKVKYATPHERHFLRLVKEYGGTVLVCFDHEDSTDETMLRASQSVIRFPLPSSPLKRLTWGLKNYTFHGIEIST